MDIVYPAQHAQIYIPKDFNNSRQKTVFEATHRVSEESIHWHLNETYLGSTSDIHQIEVDTEAGSHTLTLVDGKGESLVRRFTVLER
jgi:penicillin-binding protein 1C